MRLRWLMLFALCLLAATHQAQAQCTNLPYTFTNGPIADANQVNSNLSALLACAQSKASAVANNTFSGNNTFTGNNTYSGTALYGADQFSGAFGPTSVLIGVTGGANAFVGQIVNNAAPGTSILPVGATGASKVTTNGNIAFGIYGLCEARWSTGGVCVAGEVTARNFTANNPDTGLPPNTGFNNTTSTTVNGWHVTCGAGGGETKDCSIGLEIANESGVASDPVFTTGQFIYLYRQFGLVIKDMPSGTQTGALIQGNGNGIVLQVQTTAEPVAGNLALNIENHLAQNLFSVRADGGIYTGTSSAQGISATKTPNGSCNLVFTNGLLTGGTC